MVAPDPNSPDRHPLAGNPRLVASGASDADRARAHRLGLDVGAPPDQGLWLQRIDGRLCLCGLGQPFAVDFERGPMARRLGTAQRRDPLGRAFGLHRRAGGRVLDATGGWLRDAATLASLGCEVVAVERDAIVHWLAEDGLARAEGAPFRARLSLVLGDARRLLAEAPATAARWDAIYLDPMFDAGDAGSAAPGKEGQLLRALAAPSEIEADRALFDTARAAKAGRIVVKRHPGAPPLGDAPSFSVASPRTRFDVHL